MVSDATARSLAPGPLAQALERNRSRFNARFAVAHRLDRRLDPVSFSDFLVAAVDPVVRAIGDPDAVDRVVEQLYDVALEVVAAELPGRHPEVLVAWQRVLPAVASLLPLHAQRIAAAVTNAVHTLDNEASVKPGVWLEGMAQLGPDCEDVDTLMRLGGILAWRAGMAHYRDSALAALRDLPDELAFRVIGVDPAVGARVGREALEARLSDPWRDPVTQEPGSRSLGMMCRVGGFRGLGGPFLAPPRVASYHGQLWATDGEVWWTVHADRFGATFRRHGPQLPPDLQQDRFAFDVSEKGRVELADTSDDFPELSLPTSAACDGRTLAVTVRTSHRIALLAVRGA